MTTYNESDVVTVTALGIRGSMPVCGDATAEFGGATSCYRVEAAGQMLYLDAGTGLAFADVGGTEPIHILLTHAHVDHILGLPMLPALLDPSSEIHIYGTTRLGLDVGAQLERLIAPPLWPLALRDYPANILCHEFIEPLQIGPFRIDGMESPHPGGSTIYRVTVGGKRLVYATDFEHTDEGVETLSEFARDADLLLYDAAYSDEEYPCRIGYGHSTPSAGLRVQRLCGAKRLRLVHPDPGRTDSMLREAERSLGVRYARQGEVIII